MSSGNTIHASAGYSWIATLLDKLRLSLRFRLRLGECRVRSHHQGGDSENDLGKSPAEAETEAQLLAQEFDPAAAWPRVIRVGGSHLRPRSTHLVIPGPRQPTVD